MNLNGSAASSLEGMKLDNGWTIEKLATTLPNSTGGCFSIGYIARHESGMEGYLKALDYASALRAEDTPKQLEIMGAAYNFECALLEKCKERRLRRIVTPIEKGNVHVPAFGLSGKVDYIIFEKALSNIRDHYTINDVVDASWALRIMHQSMVAIKQLHSIEIAHQDIKPSNVLDFPRMGAKLSDLGCASDKNHIHSNDDKLLPGDMSYAPPEQFYGFRVFQDFRDRYLADLYQVGSLLFFHFLEYSAATHAIRAHLSKNPNLSNESFEEDLPYIKESFDHAIGDLEEHTKTKLGNLAGPVTQIARELCEPDPRLRALKPFAKGRNFNLTTQQYISRLDILATKAEMGRL